MFRYWTDLIFPPLCAACREPCQTKLFCPACWELSSPAEKEGKCPHCFEDSRGLCRTCIKKPLLPFSKAFVFEKTESAFILAGKEEETVCSYFVLQWGKLNWPIPDVVVPMPGAQKLAKIFSEMVRCPMADILMQQDAWECDEKAILEEQILLVLDRDSPMDDCQKAIRALSKTFPKKGYLLRLFA